MARRNEMVLSFPPFTPAVKWILGICTGVFLLTVLLDRFAKVGLAYLLYFGALSPQLVVHGSEVLHVPHVWQLLTYAFIHYELWHWFGNMLVIWMFGSQLEQTWRSRRFLELFLFSSIGAALVTVALAYTGILGNLTTPTIGASGGAFGILMAFGMLFGDQEIMFFPFPIQIKAKYFIGVLIVVEIILAIRESGNGVAYLAHLGGLLFGYIYVKTSSREGFSGGMSERYYALRNSYHRWKRRRAARKFQVYMKKHDREVFFDEYGNYRGPQTKDDDSGHKGPWVN